MVLLRNGEYFMEKVCVEFCESEGNFCCPNCGGSFHKEEMQRMFSYSDKIDRVFFVPTFCMDCGVLWSDYTVV